MESVPRSRTRLRPLEAAVWPVSTTATTERGLGRRRQRRVMQCISTVSGAGITHRRSSSPRKRATDLPPAYTGWYQSSRRVPRLKAGGYFLSVLRTPCPPPTAPAHLRYATPMTTAHGLVAARQRLFRMVRRVDLRVADRVIVQEPPTETEIRQARELAAERGLDDVAGRLRRSR